MAIQRRARASTLEATRTYYICRTQCFGPYNWTGNITTLFPGYYPGTCTAGDSSCAWPGDLLELGYGHQYFYVNGSCTAANSYGQHANYVEMYP